MGFEPWRTFFLFKIDKEWWNFPVFIRKNFNKRYSLNLSINLPRPRKLSFSEVLNFGIFTTLIFRFKKFYPICFRFKRKLSDGEQAAKTHSEFFTEIMPASIFLEVSVFINKDWISEMPTSSFEGITYALQKICSFLYRKYFTPNKNSTITGGFLTKNYYNKKNRNLRVRTVFDKH